MSRRTKKLLQISGLGVRMESQLSNLGIPSEGKPARPTRTWQKELLRSQLCKKPSIGHLLPLLLHSLIIITLPVPLWLDWPCLRRVDMVDKGAE